MLYAQLTPDGIAYAITQSSGVIDAPDMIELAAQDESVIGKRYNADTGAWETLPPPPPPPPPVWAWFIDIGPFTDRLGLASAAIDLSTEPGVVVIRNDLARRKWIDLKDQRVIAALWYLAGQAHPVLGTLSTPLLTAEVVTSTLNTPVADAENLALRKLYFS